MKTTVKTGLFLSAFGAALVWSASLAVNPATPVQKSSPEKILNFSKLMLAPERAFASTDETLLQSIRMFYRLGMGMTSGDYAAIVAGEPKVANITAADGLVGKLDAVRKRVSGAILANVPGVTTCQDVPATGQFTSGGMDVKFAAPKHDAPAGYPHGGGDSYEKRVELTETVGTQTTKAVLEFNCDVAASMFAYEVTDSGDSDNDHKMALFYDGENFDDKRFQFYFDWPSADVHMATIMEITPAIYKFWISSGKDNGDTGFRMAAIGHRDTGKVSFFADDTTGASTGTSTDTTVTGGKAPDQGVPYQGCADNFDHAPEDIASDDLCGSDTLVVGAPTVLDDLATKTVYDDVEGAIDALLAP